MVEIFKLIMPACEILSVESDTTLEDSPTLNFLMINDFQTGIFETSSTGIRAIRTAFLTYDSMRIHCHLYWMLKNKGHPNYQNTFYQNTPEFITSTFTEWALISVQAIPVYFSESVVHCLGIPGKCGILCYRGSKWRSKISVWEVSKI